MLSVFKYTLEIADEQVLDLPVGAQILTIKMQHNQPRLWALVDNGQKTLEARLLRMAGTGHPIIDAEWKYISSVMMDDGMLVFHFFERVSHFLERSYYATASA